MKNEALFYAQRGWPVLPLIPRNKQPLTEHGLKNASTDSAQIERWWRRWPDANIGLRTGIAFDVIDFDSAAGLRAAKLAHPEWRHTGPISATGKGHHLLIAVTGARNGAGLLPGMDFRGQNGYIVAPPSIHPSGHRYRWLNSPDLPLPGCPDWLLDLLFPPKPEPKGGPAPADLDDYDLDAELAALGVELRQQGRLRRGRCPFHADDTPSLVVYPNESFYCFGCGAWGDAKNVAMFRETGRLHVA